MSHFYKYSSSKCKQKVYGLDSTLNTHLFLLITVGARVFARWTNGLYYRGFVKTSDSLTVSIHYDDGDKITLAKSDKTAVILDTIPQEDDIQQGQRVIGYWPNRVRYYPGNITHYCSGDGPKCNVFSKFTYV